MYQKAIFLISMCFLVGCAQVGNTQPTETIQPSDTPTLTPTDTLTPTPTPTPTFMPTPTPTPSITPTPTEVPPPLPQGAVRVEKNVSFWMAYDAQDNEVAVWLPDPDSGKEGWSQRYAQKRNGEIVGWDTGDSEWERVPGPEGAIDGQMGLRGGVPIWEIDVSVLQQEGDDVDDFVTVGEYKDGEWELTSFETTIYDEYIGNVNQEYPFTLGRGGVNKKENGGTFSFEYHRSALLGLKLDVEDGDKQLYALMGARYGIIKTKVDIIDIYNYDVREIEMYQYTPDLDVSDTSRLLLEFKAASVRLLQSGIPKKEGDPIPEGGSFGVAYFAPVEGVSPEVGCTKERASVQLYFDVCMKVVQERYIESVSSASVIESDINGLWKIPSMTPDVDWWEQANEVPEKYIKLLACTKT